MSGIVSSVDHWKILLTSLPKYAISGQSDTEADLLPDLYGFSWIWFQINHFGFSEKYADFFHRQGAIDYKAHGSDFRGGQVLSSPYLDQKVW